MKCSSIVSSAIASRTPSPSSNRSHGQTLRSTPEPEVFARAFQGRLEALASAHDMLTNANWSGTDFGALAHKQLAPFLSDDTSRLELKGPAIVVQPETATSLGLILHELATNASKYGALSVPTGSVSLVWRVGGTGNPPSLHITWRETGGPPVKPPTRRGFGSQLIEWEPASQSIKTTSQKASYVISRLPSSKDCKPRQDDRLKCQRILIIEDEAMISLAPCEAACTVR